MARDVQRNRERRTRGGALKQLPWRNYRNPYKPIEVLQEEQIERIHDASLRILEVNGIEFLDAGARDRLKAAGAMSSPAGLRVRFDREMVMEHGRQGAVGDHAPCAQSRAQPDLRGQSHQFRLRRQRPQLSPIWTGAAGREISPITAICCGSARA